MDNMESRWHFIYWKYHKHTCFINFASSLTFYMFSFEYIYIYIYIYIKTLPTTLRFRPFFEKHASAHPHPLRFHALATLYKLDSGSNREGSGSRAAEKDIRATGIKAHAARINIQAAKRESWADPSLHLSG